MTIVFPGKSISVSHEQIAGFKIYFKIAKQNTTQRIKLFKVYCQFFTACHKGNARVQERTASVDHLCKKEVNCLFVCVPPLSKNRLVMDLRGSLLICLHRYVAFGMFFFNHTHHTPHVLASVGDWSMS